MAKLQMGIALMVLVAVIIVSIAVYLFTHLGGINLLQGSVLIVAAVIGLLIIMSVIVMLMRDIPKRK